MHAGEGWLAPWPLLWPYASYASGRTRVRARIRFDLTRRERELMDLLVQGLTNGQIAAQLVLSEKTVKNHLNHVYAKLGVGHRTQAVARWQGRA